MIRFENMETPEEKAERGGCNGMTDIEADLMLAKARIAELEKLCNNLEKTRVSLTKRMRHLLQSDFIKSYDEIYPRTGEYVRDINELDNRVRYLEHLEERDNAAEVAAVPSLLPLYICDRRKCDICSPECMHTEDVRHAKNFAIFGASGHIVEQEG